MNRNKICLELSLMQKEARNLTSINLNSTIIENDEENNSFIEQNQDISDISSESDSCLDNDNLNNSSYTNLSRKRQILNEILVTPTKKGVDTKNFLKKKEKSQRMENGNGL